MRLTCKQIELMRVIAPAPIDLDEIVDAVRYETSKASLHFSIRALIKHGLIEKRGIEKRRGRQRSVVAATSMGMAVLGASGKSTPSYVASVEEDELSSGIDY